MKYKLKTALLSIVALALIFGALFVFKKPQGVASTSYYESLKIASSSLNGNSIWGGSESFDTVVNQGGLDAWAAFYSAAQKASGGLDTSGALSINGVPYEMSWTGATAYDGNDTIRLLSGHTSATISLETIGAYEQLYVLGTAGGPGEGNYANFAVRVNYTDGTADTTNYRLYDWYDATPVAGVYKWENLARRLVVKSGTTNTGWRPGQHSSQTAATDYDYEGSTSGAPYLQSATIKVDSKKLVKSIDLVLTGKNGSSDVSGIYCGIYAITGMVNVSAPGPVEIIYVDDVTETTAGIFWDYVTNATSYRLDIALDPDFTQILPEYNNRLVDATELVAEGLSPGTTYYTRVRAENSEGQSISSNVVGFTTIASPVIPEEPQPAEPDEPDEPQPAVKPAIRVDTHGYTSGAWTNTDVMLTVEDISEHTEGNTLQFSLDGTTWREYTEEIIYDIDTTEDGAKVYFKAISSDDLESDIAEVLVRRDTIAPTIDADESKVYYSDVTAPVADNIAIARIALDEDVSLPVSGQVSLPARADTSYRLTVCDLAGNCTTKTIQTDTLDISVTAETERWIPYDVAGISATDLGGDGKLEVSEDGGNTWQSISSLPSTTYTVEQNGTYIFRVVDTDGATAETSVTYDNIDPVKPFVEIDTHGYTLGTWTNQPIFITAENTARNLSPVKLYVREAGADTWTDYTDGTIVSEDTSGVVYEYKAISSAGLESDVVRAAVRKDAVAPTGTVSESSNAFNEILNTVTLGLLFKDTKTIELAANDDRSGVVSVEYRTSDVELSEEALSAMTGWSASDGRVAVDPQKPTFVYYRVTDHAGNVSVISRYGLVFDLPGTTTADLQFEQGADGMSTIITSEGELPLVSDLEHRTIDDKANLADAIEQLKDYLEQNPDSSLGQDILDEYQKTVDEIDETEQSIKDIDEASTEIPQSDHINSDDKDKVDTLIEQVKDALEPGNHLTDTEREHLEDLLEDLQNKKVIIEDVEERIDDIDTRLDAHTEENVSKDDLDELEDLRKEIEDLLDTDNLTDDERSHLEEQLDKIDELEKRIEEAEKALEEAKAKDEAQDITPENVRPEDQTTLEDASQGYAEALGVFDGNFSLADLFDINSRISIINSALDILDQVAEFEALVSKLPNPDHIDYGSRADVKTAMIAYNELSEYGKALVGPSLMAKYKAVVEAYRAFLEGSPLLYAFETLDVFWWGMTTFFITGSFIIITHRTHRRYIEAESDKF